MSFSPEIHRRSCLTRDLACEVYDFSVLGKLTYKEFTEALKHAGTDQNSELIKVLRDVILLDKRQMNRMNLLTPVIPNDSAKNFLNLALKPGCRIVAIKARTERGGEERIVGFGRVFLNKEDIPDLNAIPKAIRKLDILRIDRIFIVDEGREAFNGSEALDEILSKVRELAAGRIIVVKLLLGPEDLGKVWLKAQEALLSRGWDLSSYAEFETFKRKDGSSLTASFNWATFPPVSPEACEILRARTEHIASLEAWRQKRLSWVLPFIAPEGQHIIVLSGEKDAHSIAKMYPGNLVTAVKPRANMPSQKLRNLRTVEASELNSLADESADLVFCSSALPDLIGSDRASAAANTVEVLNELVSKLKLHGKLIVRETAAAAHDEEVLINLNTKRKAEDEPSTAEKFEFFIRELKRRGHIENDVPLGKAEAALEGWRCYHVSRRLADEFLLKLKYYKDWGWELDRHYCVTTAKEREQILSGSNLRRQIQAAENNRWTVKNVWEGHVFLQKPDGSPLPYPSGSYVTVLKRVAPDEGLDIKIKSQQQITASEYLEVKAADLYRDGHRLGTIELIGRPHPTLDVIPRDERFLAKLDFPRPLITTASKALDGIKVSPYLFEQIAQVMVEDEKELDIEEAVKNILLRRANFTVDELKETRVDQRPLRYFPYLGTSDAMSTQLEEEVLAFFADIPPRYRQAIPEEGYSGFSTSGRISPVAIDQILHGCQVGSIRDARLERMGYEDLLRGERALPFYLGEQLNFPEKGEASIELETIRELISDSSYTFKAKEPDPLSTKLLRAEFSEVGPNNEELACVTREYFSPANTPNMASILPLRLYSDEASRLRVAVGFEKRLSPLVYERSGGNRSFALSVPSFFLEDAVTADAAKEVVKNYITERGNKTGALHTLGSPYFVSPGISGLMAVPYIVFLESSNDPSLHWVPIEDALNQRSELMCGQALTSLFRGYHACQRYLK